MKVAFFQPRHFNRTERKTNPFFDPVVEVCREAGIPYRIFQPYRHPDTGYPVVHSSQYLRKFVRFFRWSVGRLLKGRSKAEIDRLAGKTWNLLTLGSWRADVYVTIAYELHAVLPGINPKARIVDIQHGIICPGHWGYLDSNGKVSGFLLSHPEREVWVSGEGYRRLFLRDEHFASWVATHVHVIGSPAIMEHQPNSTAWHGGRVLISLQLTSELDRLGNEQYLNAVCGFLREYVSQGGSLKLVTIRHHPRYNNCIDISDMLKEFTGIHLSSEPFSIIIQNTAIHVTVDSTTAFDAAAYGVPTYFIKNKATSCHVRWDADFCYPYADWHFTRLESDVKARPDEVCRAVQTWYGKYYAPFDPAAVRALLQDGAPGGGQSA